MLLVELLASYAKKMSVEAGEPRTLAEAEAKILVIIDHVARSIAKDCRKPIAYLGQHDIA